MEVRELQLKNAFIPILVTVFGMLDTVLKFADHV